MSNRINRAMVLSAGLGTRLSPITQKLPKPLVSVLNIPNILQVLYNLKRAGVETVVMNLHHLSESMEAFFNKRNFYDLKFHFTHEDPIQGTGGGVKNAERFFSGSHFILANCDFVTNIDISRHIKTHFSLNSMASMLLIQDETKANLYSKVGVDSNSRLVSLPKLEIKAPDRVGIFTGIHILNSEVLKFLEPKPCGINDVLYPKLIREFPNSVFGLIDSEAFWQDTGDIPVFFQTSQHLLKRLVSKDPFTLDMLAALDLHYEEVMPNVWIEAGSPLPKGIQIKGPAMIGSKVSFGHKCKIGPNVIIGEDCLIGDNCQIRDSVLLPGAQVAESSDLSRVIQFENSALSANTPV